MSSNSKDVLQHVCERLGVPGRPEMVSKGNLARVTAELMDTVQEQQRIIISLQYALYCTKRNHYAVCNLSPSVREQFAECKREERKKLKWWRRIF